MKSLDFLEQADHSRKAAIYVAAHDGTLRNFAYTEELGECRETFSRLLQDVQEGEIGVVLTHDAACLAIEASPGWMEAFISPEEYEKERSAPRPLVDAIAQSPFAAAYIERDENWFLVTRLEGKGADAAIYGLSSVAIGQDVDMFGLGRWKELLEILAPYGITEEGGWCPVPPERKDWLSRTQQQEDEMAVQAGAAMGPHRASLPKGAHLRVILPGSRQARGKQSRKQREKAMSKQSDFTREEYELAKVVLEREDVPSEALALLSAWIEGERLLVDDREEVGGITYARMDARIMAPLPHVVASFFARWPYKRKAGHYPNWNGFYLLLYRDVEEGWKLMRIRRDTSYAQFVPLFAARIKAEGEINSWLGKE